MLPTARFLAVLLLIAALRAASYSQAETVPAHHPVYPFLKRMEVKGILTNYHDGVLPLSRREVGEYLALLAENQDELTRTDVAYLGELLSEFQLELIGSTEGFNRVILPQEGSFWSALGEEFSDREKFLFFHSDSTIRVFANVLVDLDVRRGRSDLIGKTHAEYFQFGGRIRGTLWGKLGFSAQITNAQFWGSRELLERDPYISQSHALGVVNAQNFDFAESYLRFDAGWVSAQLGRERVLWGSGVDERMTLGDRVRLFDFIRADAGSDWFRYTFMHAWLLGLPDTITFTLPFDPDYEFLEQANADKYFAAHRVSFSIGGAVDLGAQEMVIYSNRSPDLAYLNPLAFIESFQRSRGERDNVFWAFDAQLHVIPNVELQGTILYDDLNVPDLFSDLWTDRYAWQAGLTYADPFTIPDLSLAAEYTRVEPYVFSHGRSREGSYTSLTTLLGPRIGPNADSWFLRADYRAGRNLWFSADVTLQRMGENVVDSTGVLLRNVGGDEFQPHRDTDPLTKEFLDGIRVDRRRIRLAATWEVVNQIWLEAWYIHHEEKNLEAGSTVQESVYALHAKLEF